MPARRDILVMATGLVVLVVICYAQTLGHEFVNYDDHRYITRNVHVQQGLTFESIAWAFTTFDVANWHPLTWISHMLDFELFGLEHPGGHHFTNVALHAANTVLLLVVLLRLTGSPWRSALVAALFGIHPLHVESVAWISERKDLLSTFFGLLAIWTYAAYTARPNFKRYAAMACLFALGLMSKPMLVTMPALLLLLDIWPLRRMGTVETVDDPGRRFALARLAILEKLPLLALSIASSIMTLAAQSRGGALSSLEAVPLTARLANALISYVTYVRQMFWPVDLAPLYPLPSPGWPGWEVGGAGAALVVISAMVCARSRKRPYLLVGWLWYLIALTPVIGLVQVGSQSHADRYTYVPLIGLFIMIAWSLPGQLFEAPKRRGANKGQPPSRRRLRAPAQHGATALAIACTLALVPITCSQVRHWHDSVALSEYALRITPDNAVVHFNLANAWIERGQTEQAIPHFQNAASLKPRWADPSFNLGNALQRVGRLDEAIAAYEEALRRQPRFPDALTYLGLAWGKRGDDEKAMACFEQAVEFAPAHAMANLLLGNALAQRGRVAEALPHFAASLQSNPNDARAHMSMAAALLSQGQTDAAMSHYRRAAELAQAAGQTDLVEEIRRHMQRDGMPKS